MPQKVEEVPAEQCPSWEWPAKCDTAATLLTLTEMQSSYKETIAYTNAVGKQTFTRKEIANNADEQQKEASALDDGDLLIIHPDTNDGIFPLTPFWMAMVDCKEGVPADVTTVPLHWYGCFKSTEMQSDVTGKWLPLCKGYNTDASKKNHFHPYDRSKCRGTRHGALKDSVSRDQVALYFPKLTPKAKKIAAATKPQLWKLREKLNAGGGIPKEWKPKDK